ncbi:MAG: VPS10 domain-containing protein [Bacteroidota bacterium]
MKQIGYSLFLGALTLAFHPVLSQSGENPLLESFEGYQKLKQESEYHLEWISLGPVMNSARLESVQGIPGKPGTIYAAFGSGNLWKTTDNGLTWDPLFENQPVLGIGDIAVSPVDHDIIWLGSGESLKKARNFTMPGAGVYKSNDAGKSWEHLGLDDTYHTGEIATHPVDLDKAFVAAMGHFWSTNENRGVYMTEDGGKTWEHVLYIDEKTGANDIVIAPSNPDIVYASMWENYPGISGKNSGIYKSSDGGKTWEHLTNGLPRNKGTGRIGLAVSHTNPDKVYALIDNLSNEKNKHAEVYKTTDGGRSWERTHEEDLLIFPGIGWYFADIYVNPHNDERVYALGVRMAYSSNGGKTFSNVGGSIFHLNPSPANFLHLDMCELWIDPDNPERLLLASDGGLYQSWNNGKTWMHHNKIPAGEFYDISVSPGDPYTVYGGTQDDASVYGPPKEWNPSLPDGWKYVWLDAWSGGDGCMTFPDPEDPNTVYFSMQNGAARRKDMAADTSVSIRPQLPENHEGKQEYAFVAPYFCSPHDSKTLYHAGNYVFKSTDRGDNWKLISPDLSESGVKDNPSTTAGAIAESPLRKGLLYLGTDRGLFWTTKDDGETWIESEYSFPDEYIRSICPSNHDESRVYMAITGLNHDDMNNYLYVSEDYGQSWSSISNNLPNEVANVIVEDPANENILYAGLYRGVYVSTNRGRTWSLLGKDMPACSVSDLVIQEKTGDLVAGTHGRGIYRVNTDPLRRLNTLGKRDTSLIFDIPSAKLPERNDTHNDIVPGSMKKVPITFYLESDREVTLQLVGNEEKILWDHKMHGKKGLNQYRWNLVTEKVDNQKPYFVQYKKFPPAGTYKLRIAGDDMLMEKEFAIHK